MSGFYGWSYKPHVTFTHLASVSFIMLIVLVYFFSCGLSTSLRERLPVHHQLLLDGGVGGRFRGLLALHQQPSWSVRLFFFQVHLLQVCSGVTFGCPFFPGAERCGVNWRRLMEVISALLTSPAWCLMTATWSRSTTCRALKCHSVAPTMQTPAGCL